MIRKLKKQSLRVQLVIIICIIMIPLILLVLITSAVSLNNAQNRLMDVYENDVKVFEQQISSVTEDLKTETDNFYMKNVNVFYRNAPMEQMSIISIVDELRGIWQRTDLLLGAYLKCEDTAQVYITHDIKRIPFKTEENLKRLLEQTNFREDPGPTWTLMAEDHKYYWVWAYYYNQYTIGFIAPLDAVVDAFEAFIGSTDKEIYFVGPDHEILGSNINISGTFNVDENQYFSFSTAVKYLDTTMYLRVPKHFITQNISLSIRVLQFLGIFAVILIPALWFAIKYIVMDSMDRMNMAMKEIEQDHMDYRLDWEQARSRESAYMERTFNHMVSQIQNLRIEKYEMELKEREIETVNLKLQMNPHLLLNSLSMIVSLAKTKNYAMIQKFARHLAGYFRYSLRNPNAMVTVAEEMAFVKSYLEIQKIRYPGAFICVYDVAEALKNIRIPSLLIENFVENAIKYALKMDSEIEIIIVGRMEGEFIILSIVDNGNGMPEDVLEKIRNGEIVKNNIGDHIGIWNIRRRLELIYGDTVELNISSKLNSGTQIWLKIPKEWGGIQHETVNC